MPMVQEFLKKLNANEKMVVYGAAIVVIAFLVGLVGSYGFGSASTDLIAAIAVVVIYWLKYSPTAKINWPAPVPTIVLVISGIAAVFALLAALTAVGLLFGFGLFGISLIINAVGCGMMAWFAYKEYQAMPKATPPATPPSAPPAA